MQVKTRVKGGAGSLNHTETLVCAKPQTKGIRVKTGIKAGIGISPDGQHVYLV